MKFADMPEQDIIKAAQQGDGMAMEHLLKHYQGLMNYICDKYYLKDGERDDLMQEAMIGFVQSVKSYKPESGKQFKNFAYLCIKRELDSCVKRSNRKKHMVLNEAVSMSNYNENDEQVEGKAAYLIERDSRGEIISPENTIVERESYAEIMQKITTLLSKMELNVLIMRMMGMSYNEITLALQLENKSVDNAVQRIRKKVNKSETLNCCFEGV
ncbi:MAG: sigma-70 family RNA polymerase sigma factor [Peptococcaceae bacterium]|nr:sigma-70 family RNA polymerase sigma factor [Peptococcaceae bacterium]